MPPKRTLRSLLNRRMALCMALGFSSGLPLYVLMQLIPAWLRTEGVGLAAIGAFNLVGLPYTWKFLWAPLADRFVPPILGRRRGWALLTQIGLFGLMLAFGALNPGRSTGAIAVIAALVALFSATQDIAVDAYRRELLPDEELGLGNALFVNVYRASALVPGGLALIVADSSPWWVVHTMVASCISVGIVATLLAPELPAPPGSPRTLREAVVGPFLELTRRGDWTATTALLSFMFLYKLGDSLAAALLTPFYLDVGFTLVQIGTVAKVVGLWSSVAGVLIGGVVIARTGINRALWMFGVLQLVTTLGFAALARIGPDLSALAVVVAIEYLSGGLGTAAFVAFIARATDRRFTATQFALFSSFIALPRTVAAAASGLLVERVGYDTYYVLCAVLGLPGMLLLLKVAPWREPERAVAADTAPTP